MSNETIFYTQIGGIILFITSLFVLYRQLVEKKDATIQLLEKQLQAAKDEAPDILIKKLSERVQIANAEMERLSKDKQIVDGATKDVRLYIDSANKLIVSQQELIELHEALRNQLHGMYRDYVDTVQKRISAIVVDKGVSDSMKNIEEARHALVRKARPQVPKKIEDSSSTE